MQEGGRELFCRPHQLASVSRLDPPPPPPLPMRVFMRQHPVAAQAGPSPCLVVIALLAVRSDAHPSAVLPDAERATCWGGDSG